MSQELDFDYVVIGGGTAGCIVASRLSENSGVRVLLLEAGQEPPPQQVTQILTNFNGPMFWPDYTEPFVLKKDFSPPDAYEEKCRKLRHEVTPGRGLGGGGSVNAAYHYRGCLKTYDLWEKLGAKGWTAVDMLQWFKKSENQILRKGIDPQYHGINGPYTLTSYEEDQNDIDKAFLTAATTDVGFPRNFDFNGASNEGFGIHTRAIDLNRMRVSSYTAFIKPIINKRNNLIIITNAFVFRLKTANTTNGIVVKEVHYFKDGEIVKVKVNREAIICAHAHRSPLLLMWSGIGPKETLLANNIPCLIDLQQVGKNLQDHLDVRLVYSSFKKQKINSKAILEKTAQGCPNTIGGFFYSTLSKEGFYAGIPDLQLSLVSFVFPPMDPTNNSTTSGYPFVSLNLVITEARGTVTIRSKDPLQPPVIFLNLVSNPRDQQRIKEGIKIIQEIMSSPSLASFRDNPNIVPSYRCSYATTHHSSGTCCIGASSREGVVDANLRVFGTTNLRIADSSVFPLIPSANTNAATMAVAEKAAFLISNEWG